MFTWCRRSDQRRRRRSQARIAVLFRIRLRPRVRWIPGPAGLTARAEDRRDILPELRSVGRVERTDLMFGLRSPQPTP